MKTVPIPQLIKDNEKAFLSFDTLQNPIPNNPKLNKYIKTTFMASVKLLKIKATKLATPININKDANIPIKFFPILVSKLKDFFVCSLF